jgi:hypothetical protein
MMGIPAPWAKAFKGVMPTASQVAALVQATALSSNPGGAPLVTNPGIAGSGTAGDRPDTHVFDLKDGQTRLRNRKKRGGWAPLIRPATLVSTGRINRADQKGPRGGHRRNWPFRYALRRQLPRWSGGAAAPGRGVPLKATLTRVA